MQFMNASPNVSPSKNKPLKKGLWKYKPRGLFSEFYGITFYIHKLYEKNGMLRLGFWRIRYAPSFV